jgi:phosphoglycolate phosphatase
VPLKRPLAFVFDLDGTLVDSRRDIAAACNHTLEALGRPALAEEVVASFVGDGSRTLLARALGEDSSSESLDQALAIFSRYYASHASVFSTWMPGAEEALRTLTPLPLTVATNKPREATLALLEALGMTRLFVAIVTGGDGPLKPGPEAILQALKPTGVAPADAWVVGDGVQDIGAARAAGATAVAVLGGFASEEKLRAAGADVVLESLRELPALVLDVSR